MLNLIFLLTSNYAANATIHKFIIETIPSITELKVKNTEKKQIQIIESWKNDGGIFFIACENPQSTIIKPNKTIKARLFAMESNTTTKWFEIEMNGEISIQHSFAKYTDNVRKFSTEAFILSNFLNQPLSVNHEQLRQDTGCTFRFDNTKYAFLSNDAIQIAWHCNEQIQRMEILDLNNYTKMFDYKNFKDTIIDWEIISNISNKKWNKYSSYQLEINVGDKKFTKDFKVYPIIVNHSLKNKVLHQSKLNITWSSIYNNFHVQIKDADNKLLVEKNNYNDTAITIEKMQEIKKLLPGKIYTLIIKPVTSDGSYQIKIPMFFLFNDNEYSKYVSFVARKTISN